MTASPVRHRAVVALLGLAVALAGGCSSRTPVPIDGLLEPMPKRGVIAPSDSDRAAVRLAEAAWAAGPESSEARSRMQEAFAELEASEEVEEALRARLSADLRRRYEKRPLGPGARARARKRKAERREVDESYLLPLAQDVINATLDDARRYRAAARELLRDYDVDPGLRQRLDRAIDDDPLVLARRRERDNWSRIFAHHFNAISEPLGKSLMTGFVMAPYQMAMSGVHWVMGMFEGDAVSVQERQALVHKKRFLRAYPDAPESAKVRRSVAHEQRDLEAMFAERYTESARKALADGRPYLARASARRALMQLGHSPEASSLIDRADQRIDRLLSNRFRSREVQARPLDDVEADPERTRRLVEALWAEPRELLRAAASFQRAHRGDDLDDEAAYVMSIARMDAGYEQESWDDLRGVASRDPRRSNMARHASAVVSNPWQNPYDAFREARKQGTREAVAHEVLGQWKDGPRYKSVPAVVGYLLDLPSVVRTAVLTPIRALLGTFRGRPDFYRDAAAAAYRYLGRFPDGEYAHEVFDWLIEYEEDRGNYEAAIRLADFRPGFDSEERTEWVEKAAEHRLAMAAKIKRRDERGSILKSIVKDYPDSAAGHHAGIQARNQVIEATAQRIRMTRSFLEENPKIAGHQGLGIRRALLDGDLDNGELHPHGVAFLGGQQLEFSLVDDSGDENHLPVRVRRKVSTERLSRTVALLDETTIRNALVDQDDQAKPDAQRDRFFERARLGLTNEVDPRPTAESTYVFRSMRERYGVVRGRESVLPFDLVLQGSLEDMSLGAFPRWRKPKETPDAFLYK
ncbi:MAG: hypothetical protein ACQGVK_22205 [Myxococcota bacterium]